MHHMEDVNNDGHDTPEGLAGTALLEGPESSMTSKLLTASIETNGIDLDEEVETVREEIPIEENSERIIVEEDVDGSALEGEAADNPPDESLSKDQEGDKDEPINPPVMPKYIYLVTKMGIIRKQNPKEIKRLVAEMEVTGINKFVIFKRQPLLMAIAKNEAKLTTLNNPDAGDIQITSTQLYAKVVTYRRVLTRFIKRRLNKEKDKTVQTSKIVWVVGLIVVIALIIVMIIAIAMDTMSGADTPTEDTQIKQGVSSPLKPAPNLEITPEPTKQATQQTDSNKVYVPPSGANQ